MSAEIKLSERQQVIVHSQNKPLCIKAIDGSGKTRVLTERIKFLLDKTKQRIIALTFTDKAGEDIKERLNGLDKRVFIGTFYGFCQKALKNHGYLIGFEKLPYIFENKDDRLELIEQAINLTPAYRSIYRTKEPQEQKSLLYQLLHFIAEVKRNDMGDIEKNAQSVDDEKILLYKNYQDILISQNSIDVDDLLLFAYKLFVECPPVADLYRQVFYAICIDEAQDLNNAQYQFLLAFTDNQFQNVMMVGDPNQSVFYSNESSPKYMDKLFVKDFNPEVIELKENYRFSQAILDATKKVFPNTKDIPHTVQKGVFELQGLENEEKEVLWITNKINELTSIQEHEDIEGPITYEKIAILACHKYLFNPVKDQLKHNDIPFYYKMSIGSATFESDLINVFHLALKVKLEPQNRLHKKKLFKKLGADVSEEKPLENVVSSISHEQYKIPIQLVIDLYEDGSNLKHLLRNFKERIIEGNENEKNMIFNDIDDLIKYWDKYEKKADTTSLRLFRYAIAVEQVQAYKPVRHKAVTLGTIHSMKGQEFDIVFLMGMDDQTFPNDLAIQRNGLDLKQEENDLYVAFTRAKRFLYVTWPKKRKMPWGDESDRKISSFLKAFD